MDPTRHSQPTRCASAAATAAAGQAHVQGPQQTAARRVWGLVPHSWPFLVRMAKQDKDSRNWTA